MFAISAKRKKLVLSLLLLGLAIITYQLLHNGDSLGVETDFRSVSGVDTDSRVYAFTAVIDDDSEDEDIRMFVSVCRGLKIKPTVFFDSDWANDNKEVSAYLCDNCEVGLLLGIELFGRTQSRASSLLADENDAFYKATGRYPRYCMAEKDLSPDASLGNAMASFGQICISNLNELNNTEKGKIDSGSIVFAGSINESSAYELAESVTEALRGECECVSVSMLLNNYGDGSDG